MTEGELFGIIRPNPSRTTSAPSSGKREIPIGVIGAVTGTTRVSPPMVAVPGEVSLMVIWVELGSVEEERLLCRGEEGLSSKVLL